MILFYQTPNCWYSFLLCVNLALVFFHRFYAKQTFEAHKRWVVSLACIFLAGKGEEDMKKVMKVINAGENLIRSKFDLRLKKESQDFKTIAEKILLTERILLHTLSFDVSVEHPHNGINYSFHLFFVRYDRLKLPTGLLSL